MSATRPFSPHPGSNRAVTLAAAVAQVVLVDKGDKQLRITNIGANPVHFRAYSSANTPVPVASQLECVVAPNMSGTFTKAETHDSVTIFSTLGTTVHICTGEGW